MIRLDDLVSSVRGGREIEDILRGLDWRGFEKMVSRIFEENGFRTTRNFRFKTEHRYEIDIIASRPRTVVCVDCKEWSMGRNKKHALKKASIKQKQRTEQFKKFISENPDTLESIHIVDEQEFYPIMVTLYEESIKDVSNVKIVPVWKLNTFLNRSNLI